MSTFLWLLPFIEAMDANKIVDKRIESIADEIPESEIHSVVYEKEADLNNAALECKKTIDDKAKTALTTIAVTVAISTSLLGTFVNSRDSVLRIPIVGWTCIFFSFVLLFHMISSAILALHEMQERNKISEFPPKSDPQPSEDDKYLARYSRMENEYLNVIRNNLVNSSYRHIVHGLVFMGMLFLFMSVTSQIYAGVHHVEEQQLQITLRQDLDSLKTSLSEVELRLVLLSDAYAKEHMLAAEQDHRLDRIMADLHSLRRLVEQLEEQVLP